MAAKWDENKNITRLFIGVISTDENFVALPVKHCCDKTDFHGWEIWIQILSKFYSLFSFHTAYLTISQGGAQMLLV